MRALFLAALFLIAVGFGLAFGFGFAAQRVASGINGSVALGAATLVATTWFGLWQFEKTKRKEAEARIFAQRAEIYHRLVVMLRDMIFAVKGWSEQRSETDLARDLSAITYDMIVWGGQDTIRQLMNLSDTSPTDVGGMMRRMSDLFRAIRKDLGHSDDAQLPEDIVLAMIVSDEREAVRAQMRSTQ